MLPPTAVKVLPSHTWSEKAKELLGRRSSISGKSTGTGRADSLTAEVLLASKLHPNICHILIFARAQSLPSLHTLSVLVASAFVLVLVCPVHVLFMCINGLRHDDSNAAKQKQF